MSSLRSSLGGISNLVYGVDMHKCMLAIFICLNCNVFKLSNARGIRTIGLSHVVKEKKVVCIHASLVLSFLPVLIQGA